MHRLRSHGSSEDSDSERSSGSSDSLYKLDRKSTSAIMEFPQDITENRKKTKRIYYLDWLRIGAIYLVVVYHCVQALRWIGFWKPEAEYRNVLSFMATCLQFGMPMFFHISGRAQALSMPAGCLRLVCERAKRLLVPFLVCFIVLIPPWRYVDMYDYDHNVAHPMWRFLIWYWKPIGTWLFGGLWRLEGPTGFIGTDVAWLWFLPVLFIISVLSNPLFLFAEHRSKPMGVFSAVIWLVLAWLLHLAGFSWEFAFWAVIGPFFMLMMVSFIPLPSRNQAEEDEEDGEGPNIDGIAKNLLAVSIITIFQLVSNVMLVTNFSYTQLGAPKKTPVMIIPMVTLYLTFYVHGYFVQRWTAGSEIVWAKPGTPGSLDDIMLKRKNSDVKCKNLRTIVLLFQTLGMLVGCVIVCASSPIGAVEVEMYPIYSGDYLGEKVFAMHHVMGTWAYIGTSVFLAQAYLNEEIQPWLYRHASRSTVVVYIFHWVFIKMVAFWVIKDFDLMHGLWKSLLSPAMLYVAGLGGSLGIYYLCLQCPLLGGVFGT